MTGAFWRGSQIRTEPSRPPVTISQGPQPWPSLPAPSTQFTTLEWACACQKTFYFSRSRIERLPAKSPKAKHRLDDGLAAKVPDLTPLVFQMVEITLSSPLVSWVISMRPVALGLSPHTINLVESGIHLTSQGVQLVDLMRCSMIWGAFVVYMMYADYLIDLSDSRQKYNRLHLQQLRKNRAHIALAKERLSLVIIENRSNKMNKQDLSITKPHFIDRFEKVKLNNTNKQCSHAVAKSKHKACIEKSACNQQKSDNINKQVIKLKQGLLEMLRKCKEEEELHLLLKRVAVAKQKEEHKWIVEEIRLKLAALKKQIYEQYRHNCTNPKDTLCCSCQERLQVYKQEVIKYLEQDQQHSQHQQQTIILKDRVNQRKTADKINKRISRNSYVSRNIENKFCLQDNQNERQQISNRHPKNINQEGRKSDRLSTFRINRKTDKAKSMRKKGLQNQVEENISQNNSQYFIKQAQRKNNKKSSTFRPLQNNLQPSKVQNNSNDVQVDQNINNQTYVKEQELLSHSSKRSFRKSIVKWAQGGQSADVQSHSSAQKSKFYDLNAEQKTKKSQFSEAAAGNSRISKTSERKGEDGQLYRVVKQKPKQKLASYQRSKNLKKSQICMDLTDLQSSKNIEEEKVHREREEIEQLIAERENSTDNAQSKLSRYQRERLIYGYLKKELVKMGCYDEQGESGNYLYCSNSESQARIDSPDRTHNYSTNERKRSLLSKLSIFNQSINFQVMKNKIETAISEKQPLGQNLMEYTHMLVSHGKGRKEQKIVEKFLAEVLKINDLKRLLSKKFSKELDWSPKMREMHQFYTYLQFNLQNFRMNLAKNTESNWKQLALEGKGEEFNLDQFKITEDLGNYQGLENTEITEFQHHKEIECSMRYYGIEVKRLQQLQNFFYPPPEMPHMAAEKIKQKSLKQIRQCDMFDCEDLQGEYM